MSDFKLDGKIISSFLVADPSSSRKSIRSLLSELGAKPSQVEVAEGYGDTEELIRSRKPQVLFVDQNLAGPRLSDLLDLQTQSLPPGASKAVFLLTSTGSRMAAGQAAEGEVDAMIARPFTKADLIAAITSVLQEKFYPSPTQQQIQQGLALLKTDKIDDAIACFQKAQALSPKAALANSYLGEVLLKQGKRAEARAALSAGLAVNPTHYRCLLGMVDVMLEEKDYAGAYQHARTLAGNHPVPMKRLPDFIKLSVQNSHFEDVFEFHKLVDGMGAIEGDVSSFLAAGLVICGLFHLRNNAPKEAVETFKKAEIIGRGNVKVLTRIVVALSRAGLEDELKTCLSRMPKEVQDAPELQAARLEGLRKLDPHLALQSALELIKGSTKDPLVYRMALELSVETKRKASSIEEIIDAAIQACPELKAEWDLFRS